MQSSISRIFSRLPNDFIITLACNLSDRRFCLSSYSINYLFAMACYKVFPRKWMLIFLAEDLQKLNHEFVFRFRYWSVRPDNILLTFINTIFIKKSVNTATLPFPLSLLLKQDMFDIVTSMLLLQCKVLLILYSTMHYVPYLDIHKNSLLENRFVTHKHLGSPNQFGTDCSECVCCWCG